MSKLTEKADIGLSESGLGLDELVRHGARQVIQQAIEAELQALLERFENVKTLHGRRAVVRNGYLPEREVLTAAGPIAVKVPKVRDRSGYTLHAGELDERLSLVYAISVHNAGSYLNPPSAQLYYHANLSHLVYPVRLR